MNCVQPLAGNRAQIGDISKLNIFFKFVSDGKSVIPNVSKNAEVVRVSELTVTEDESGMNGGNGVNHSVRILLDGLHVLSVSESMLEKHRNLFYRLLERNTVLSLGLKEIYPLLNAIRANESKILLNKILRFRSGKEDLVIETKDRGNNKTTIVLSIQSATDIPLSMFLDDIENNHFIFEVTSFMDDKKMKVFNNIFKKEESVGEWWQYSTTKDKIQYLHDLGCDLVFAGISSQHVKANLIMNGGKEMPSIIGGLLKRLYFDRCLKPMTIKDCISYLASIDVADYGLDGLEEIYSIKLSNLLLRIFNGMRLDSQHDTGCLKRGWISVENTGKEIMFRSIIDEDLKDFLLENVRMDNSCHRGFKTFGIYKEHGKYYLDVSLRLKLTIDR